MEEIIYPDHDKKSLLSFVHKNLEKLENIFAIRLALRGDKIMFEGDNANIKMFKKYIKSLMQVAAEHNHITEHDFQRSIHMVDDLQHDKIQRELTDQAVIKVNGREIHPKTPNQKKYIKAVFENDLVFGIGPAGTGKTYLAIAMALQSLYSKQTERIVLTRPVVEAGEKLGFLPGDIQQKVNPYFRPMYDALYTMIGTERTIELIEKEVIEIAPLAYMRGRTIDNAFIILDEGQNTLDSQMKMFLTRFGQNSKVIVTADLSQLDLPEKRKSGIFRALKILHGITGIDIVKLTEKDVIRHHLVQKIIEAYEKKQA